MNRKRLTPLPPAAPGDRGDGIASLFATYWDDVQHTDVGHDSANHRLAHSPRRFTMKAAVSYQPVQPPVVEDQPTPGGKPWPPGPSNQPCTEPDGYPESGRHPEAGRYREADRYPEAGGCAQPPRPRRDITGGADGNELLIAITGAVLLALLAAQGVTILAIQRLLTLHFFIGTLLVGPVLLKAGSTVYRFTRYYAGAAGYRRKGPPSPLLRLLGPFVLGLSLAVIGSGGMLAITGPSGRMWLLVHKASFMLWLVVMSIHVLAYVRRMPRLIGADLTTRASTRAQEVLAGRAVRWLLVTASVLAGLLLALLVYDRAGAWNGS